MDVQFDETNGSQREHLPNVLDEASPSESIKLMGTGEIIPSKEQAKEEIIISAPNQHEDTAQPEANAEDEDNDQQGQNHCPVHPRVANEVQIEKIIDSINAPGPLTRSRATQLANFCGHFAFVSISEPKKVDETFKEPEWIQAMQEELQQFELNNVWELVKSCLLKHNLKRNLSFLHLTNLKTMLRLKTILPMMTMISKSKVFVFFILVLQMRYKLRR